MANSNRTISYSKRDFSSLKQEQIDYIRKYYPDVLSDFTDASIASVFTDLNAAITDNLNFQIDRSLNETVLDFAQETQSLYNIAKTYGLKLPTKSASISVVQLTVQVPVFSDAEDKRYLPILQAGTQVIGGDQTFELLYDVDFSSPFNSSGNVDRTKIPIFNRGILSSYQISKTGIVVAGSTRIFSQIFDSSTPQSFYQIILPENNILSIDAIIHKNGTSFQTNPTYDEFFNSGLSNTWYEVNSLAQNMLFITDTTIPPDKNGVLSGTYQEANQRFIKEFTPTGFCVLTFGSKTNQSFDILDDFLQNIPVDLNSFLNNNSLGQAPIPNTTMYIKYRIGGGSETNVGIGVIDSFGTQFVKINGPNPQTNSIVQGSLTVTNITPAIGGGDAPSIEELRYFIGYNFAAQNRAVTLNDYKVMLLGMPSKFGSPSRVGVTQNQNKVEINVLSTDSNGNFDNSISSVLLNNIANYLSEFRMINDYVITKPGEVIDLGFEISVLVQEGNKINTVTQIIQTVTKEFQKSNSQMGKNYFIGRLVKILHNVSGVMSLNYIKVFNKVGVIYSNNTINQNIIDTNTNEIDLSSNVITCDEDQILQIRFPDKDIVVIPIISTPIKSLV